MKFFADEMLGKLARWLRMAGLDVAYERQIADELLIQKVKEEGVILLTRDTHLIKLLQPSEYLFITSDHLEEQFQEFKNRFGKIWEEQIPFSRCVECNRELQGIAKEEVKEKVWPYVFETQETFTTCPQCHRIYWEATHVKKIREKLKHLGKNSMKS